VSKAAETKAHIIKTYKFRIYPSKKQEMQMKDHLKTEKNLWNELLDANKKKYETEKRFLTTNEMHNIVKDKGLYSQTAQALSQRLENALWKMIKMKKQGKKCGFPRFKSIDRMKSLYYPQFGFKLDKKLSVTPFGEISIKQHREIKGKIKTLTLKRESSGKWFAVLCVVQERQECKESRESKEQKSTIFDEKQEKYREQKKEKQENQIGVDLGLIRFATLSNGEIIENPKYYKKYEERLALLQRKLSKKEKGSKNREKAKHKVAVVYEKIANARLDFLHKISNKLVNSYSFIALEKLNSKEMSKRIKGKLHLGKHIIDAGWNKFTNMLCYKAEEAGCRVVFVEAKNTTQECSNCHRIVEKQLSDRIHHCPFCGLKIDRDLNSALNILIRATQGHCGSNACRDQASTLSHDMASMVKEAGTICSV
jgi:putative transposase